MPCVLADIDLAPACLALTSQRRQLQDTLFLLAAAINKIDGAVTINWPGFLVSAKAVAACVPTGVARSKAAQITEAGLVIANLKVLDCWSEGDLELVRLYLTCLLIGKINP